MSNIETPRLILRNFFATDLERVAELTSDPSFMRFSGGSLFDQPQAEAFLERLLAPIRLGKPSQFAVILRANQKLIGYCGFFIRTVDDVEELELGYRLDPEFWGQGLATEAARAVRDHAFRDLNAERVISLIVPENLPSRQVALKNGMRLEKETIFRCFQTQVFALRRAEWEKLALVARVGE